MSNNPVKTEKISCFLKYYDIIKSINDSYLNYMKTYNLYTNDYYQKLLILQKESKLRMNDILKKLDQDENTDLIHIIKVTNAIPRIFDLYIENLEYLLKNIEKEIKLQEDFLKEKEIMISKLQTQYRESKKELSKKENDINKSKNTFLDNMYNTEEIIYKFYSSQIEKKAPVGRSSQANQINLNKVNYAISEEQVNNSINNSKKLESNYEAELETGKALQEKFIEMEQNSNKNIKSIICDISIKLRQSVINVLIHLKNNYKIPHSEIDNFLPDLISEDGNKKIEETFNKILDNNVIEKITISQSNYNLEVLKDDNAKPEVKKNITKSNSKSFFSFLGNKEVSVLTKQGKNIRILEDGLNEIPFIDDEIAFLTTKKMLSSFKLINNKGFNMEEEEEKTNTKKITTNLLSNYKRSSLLQRSSKKLVNKCKEEKKEEENKKKMEKEKKKKKRKKKIQKIEQKKK